jgi:hypothetical protein
MRGFIERELSPGRALKFTKPFYCHERKSRLNGSIDYRPRSHVVWRPRRTKIPRCSRISTMRAARTESQPALEQRSGVRFSCRISHAFFDQLFIFGVTLPALVD